MCVSNEGENERQIETNNILFMWVEGGRKPALSLWHE